LKELSETTLLLTYPTATHQSKHLQHNSPANRWQ